MDPKIENLYIKAVYKEGEKTKTNGVSDGTIAGKSQVLSTCFLSLRH